MVYLRVKKQIMNRILTFFLLFAVNSFGQHIKFENFTTNQGLSNNSVGDIESDSDGGLWIATWDGLNYFDGYNFKIFKNDFNNPKTISSNYVTKLKKDTAGKIWIMTKEGHVNCYLGNEEFKEFKFKTTPKDIYLSQKGNIIVETTSAYYEYKNKTFVETAQNNVRKIDVGNLKKMLLEKYPKLTINDVLKDKAGNIWFATRENGLFIITNENKIEHLTADLYTSYSFKNNEIETLHLDDFGNIWLGQKDGGLSMAFTGSEKINWIVPHPLKEPNLPDETIRAVTKDNKGRIWLGYYTRGLYYYNDRSHVFEKFKIDKAGSHADWKRIRSLFTSSDGSIWAGTYKGILRIANNTCTSYETNNTEGAAINRCYSIIEDHNKQLWIGGWGGLAKFNLITGKFEAFEGQELLRKYHIRNVKKNNQNLIISTEHSGVIVFNLTNHSIKKITTKEGILGNSVYSVFVDNESDNYWIASLGGVSVFNKKTGLVKNITESDGLPSHMVYGLIDNGEKVWISTTKGIASIDKKKYTVTAYNPDHGWQATEFSEGAYYQDSKGNLFFGGVEGLNYFNPGTIYSNASKGKAKIKLKIDGTENTLTSIEKSFSKNGLEIEVIPIVFPRNKKNDIYYKLEGRDENWIPLPSNNKIEYADLSSGQYNFIIKQGKDGKPEPALFTLQIGKAFYESILFYILLSGVILLICIAVIYVKNKASLVQQKYMEELVAARTAVIENQKKEMEAVNEELDEKNKKILEQKEKLLILHSNLKKENFEIEKFKSFMLAEFQEPISKIIKISGAFKKDTETHRDLIAQSGKLVALISEWNYLEHVKDLGPIKKSVASLFPVFKNNVEKLKKDLQRNEVNFNCEIDTAEYFVAVDILRLKLAMQYFFNDLSKYSDKDSTLDIEIAYEENAIAIKAVSDSDILRENWYNISHYSPYFKALQVLLGDLQGELIPASENDFQITLRIPIETADQDSNFKETISWKNFNYSDEFSTDKKCLLVFGDAYNNPAASQVLESENFNLIFESSVFNLNSVMKQIDISALVLYQTEFSKKLIDFLKQTNENSNVKIPMIYISEDINYELNEQLLEIGIETHIQLPASASFVRKKVNSLINQNIEPLREHKIQEKIFEILTEDNEHVTANDRLLKRALEIIKEQLHNPSFNVEMLGEELGISRVKCYRLFKESLHQSPSDILMSLRLQKAEVLLKTKRLNISEISFECGYNDPKYFGRSFKKYYGKTPKEFKEHKEYTV